MAHQSSTSRGALVAIEGLDRAGKSTQCDLLLSRLQQEGKNVKLQKFPDRTTTIGKMIDSYLKSTSQLDDHAIHLLFSANRWELAAKILADVNGGTTVILDRYVYSGVVFSAAKGLGYEYCRSPDTGLPRPDAVIFLDLSAADAAKRGGFGEERYEVPTIQKRVREMFGFMMEDERDAGDWNVVNAGKSVEEVQEEIWRLVEKVEGFARENALRRIS